MLSVPQAESIILNLVQPLKETQTVNLEISLGRILACVVTSEQPYPYWDNSAMDGYAVKYSDVNSGVSSSPAILEVIEEIPAGKIPQKSISTGQSARIFTGAMLPLGADTVVMQENTIREGNKVYVLSPPEKPQAFVRRRGDFYTPGNPLLTPGIAISPPDIAILATVGCTNIPVYRRPIVAILSTGDELVPPNQPLQPGQIVDSNQYALAAFVAANGAIPKSLGIIPDNPELLKQAINQAINSADMVLSTGGVSVGDYDYVEKILAELGGEIHIRSVGIKPGKPLTVASFSNCLYFGMPGNPVSALVSCWRFVQPALKKLSGLATNYLPAFVKGRSRVALHSNGKLETYIWGKISLVNGEYEFEPASGGHNSGNLINLSQTKALAVVPVGQTLINQSEEVQIMIFC